MIEVDLDLAPRLEPEGASAVRAADRPERVRVEHAAPAVLPPCDALELAELLEGVDPNVRVAADAERDPAVEHADRRDEAVAQVGLGRRAGADRRAAVPQQVELRAVGVRCVDDRRQRPQAARVGEQLDRALAVLCEALLDLARLLAGVDMQDEPLGGCVAAELDEPVARARADGVGGEPDGDTAPAEPLDLLEIRRDRRLSHALEPATRIGDVEAHERDPGAVCCLRGGIRRLEPEVVELADRREAGGSHLAVYPLVERAHRLGRLTLRLGQHAVAPGPEVATRGAPAKRPLERVAVRVHETRERDHSCHGPRH